MRTSRSDDGEDESTPPLTRAYFFAASWLVMRGEISWASFRRAIAARPVAISGRGGAFIVDECEWARMHGDVG